MSNIYLLGSSYRKVPLLSVHPHGGCWICQCGVRVLKVVVYETSKNRHTYSLDLRPQLPWGFLCHSVYHGKVCAWVWLWWRGWTWDCVIVHSTHICGDLLDHHLFLCTITVPADHRPTVTEAQLESRFPGHKSVSNVGNVKRIHWGIWSTDINTIPVSFINQWLRCCCLLLSILKHRCTTEVWEWECDHKSPVLWVELAQVWHDYILCLFFVLFFSYWPAQIGLLGAGEQNGTQIYEIWHCCLFHVLGLSQSQRSLLSSFCLSDTYICYKQDHY